MDEMSSNKSDWVTFADFEPTDFIGHPQGLEYFCAEHLDFAKRLASKPFAEALVELLKAHKIE